MQILKQIKQVGEHAKFKWQEACSDNNGKSSFMPISGVFLIFIGGIMSVYAGVTNHLDMLSQYVILSGLGATILVGRKIMEGKPPLEDILVSDTPTEVAESNETH